MKKLIMLTIVTALVLQTASAVEVKNGRIQYNMLDPTDDILQVCVKIYPSYDIASVPASYSEYADFCTREGCEDLFEQAKKSGITLKQLLKTRNHLPMFPRG